MIASARLRKLAAAGACALAAVAFPASAQDASSAQDGAGAPCELHVWGAGRPHFKMPARLLAMQDPAEMDLSNPLSNASLYNTVNRARALPDAQLRRLFPAGRDVTIIRHDEMIDLDATPIKSLTTRLAPSPASCYADLVNANNYGIFPNPDFQGLLIEAIKGGNRLVMDLWLFDRSTPGAPLVLHKRNDGPILSFRAPRADYAQSMELGGVAIATAFADMVQARRAK